MEARELLAEMTAAPFGERYGITGASAISTSQCEEGPEGITLDQFHRTMTHRSGARFEVTVVDILPPPDPKEGAA